MSERGVSRCEGSFRIWDSRRGSQEMEGLARARLTPATVLLGDPWNDVVVARTARDFEDLARALANARRACEKVRENAGPILAELTAV